LMKLSSRPAPGATLFPRLNLHPWACLICTSFMDSHPGSPRLAQSLLHGLAGQFRPVAVLTDMAEKKLP